MSRSHQTLPSGSTVSDHRDRAFIDWASSGAQLFSTCVKAQYMAILVDPDGYVIGTGYNGTPSGWQHCNDGGCPRGVAMPQGGGSYIDCYSVHAEINAFTHADATRARGGTLYVNGLPCWDCAKVIVNSGVTRLVYLEGRDARDNDQILRFLNASHMEVVEMPCSTFTTA